MRSKKAWQSVTYIRITLSPTETTDPHTPFTLLQQQQHKIFSTADDVHNGFQCCDGGDMWIYHLLYIYCSYHSFFHALFFFVFHTTHEGSCALAAHTFLSICTTQRFERMCVCMDVLCMYVCLCMFTRAPRFSHSTALTETVLIYWSNICVCVVNAHH
jgi:hypothetical protein